MGGLHNDLGRLSGNEVVQCSNFIQGLPLCRYSLLFHDGHVNIVQVTISDCKYRDIHRSKLSKQLFSFYLVHLMGVLAFLPFALSFESKLDTNTFEVFGG